jgi:hypothetical protein
MNCVKEHLPCYFANRSWTMQQIYNFDKIVQQSGRMFDFHLPLNNFYYN